MSDIEPNQDNPQDFDALIEKLVKARAFGRSPMYEKLLRYLAKETASGVVCSEQSVAVDVFNKAQDYDVTTDSTVRVYIHNLRKKLDAYYSESGKTETQQLSIPKGEYRLAINTVDSQTPLTEKLKQPSLSFTNLISAALGALVTAAILLTLFAGRPTATPELSEQQTKFWGNILTDTKPVMIVLGDYFIFAERDGDGDTRLVREFDINSATELRRDISASSSEADQERYDLGLTYLPRGSAYAVARVQEILQTTNKPSRIRMMSEFSADDLRNYHVIYIGYLSGLGVLETYAFANSRFAVGLNYDELIDRKTSETYRSDFIEAQENLDFTDFGLISSFPLTQDSLINGNQVVILAGTRDAGLMEMSDISISANLLDRMNLTATDGKSFEALFAVDGFNLTNVTSELISSDYMGE